MIYGTTVFKKAVDVGHLLFRFKRGTGDSNVIFPRRVQHKSNAFVFGRILIIAVCVPIILRDIL